MRTYKICHSFAHGNTCQLIDFEFFLKRFQPSFSIRSMSSEEPSNKFLALLQYFEQNIAQMEEKVNRLESEMQSGWKCKKVR